ncbi:hypothetical protein BDK51DRAFT_14775, partial [Blyttiomyces helicus]
ISYSFGFDSHKRSNLHYLNETTLASSIGNVLILLNLRTLEQEYMMGIREGAIGAIAVHPSRKYLAIAEVCSSMPNIYILEYPSMNILRVLREGAERGFSDICFNNRGDKLATVGMDPDYMLTIWSWEEEKIILRSKAFSQDVYRVSFSAENDGNLTTSGMGHIKFWRMSRTFTGLKLQGYIGKFGVSELSDIAAFIQLPDGKVLSSTETGNMLLWDGGMIKCELAGKGRKPCHQGRIEVVLLMDGEVFTAGEDGFVRIWDLETIDNADVTSPSSGAGVAAGASAEGAAAAPVVTSGSPQARVFEMEPMDEILLGKDVKIKSMVRCLGSSHEYLVQDEAGNLFKLDTKKRSTDKILSFHSGAITSIDTSPLAHSLVSLGADGTLRLYDYVSKAACARVKFHGRGTVMSYLPEALDGSGCTVISGFSDGIVRIVTHTAITVDVANAAFTLQYALKPHKGPITSIAVSADGAFIATASEDRTVFFFKVETTLPEVLGEIQPPVIFSINSVHLIPIGFITLDSVPVSITFSPDNHMNLEEIEPVKEDELEDPENADQAQPAEEEVDGKRALIALANGSLISLIVPRLEAVDTNVTYEINHDVMKMNTWTFHVPEPKKPPPPAENPEKDGAIAAPDIAETLLKIAADKEKAEQEALKPLSAKRSEAGITIRRDSPIGHVVYLEGGYFLVSLVNVSGEGEVRACKIGSPQHSRLLLTHRSRVTNLRLSHSGKYLLVACEDGATFLRKFKVGDIVLQDWTAGHETYQAYSMRLTEEEAKAVQRRAKDREAAGPDESFDELNRADDTPGQFWIGRQHDGNSGGVTNAQSTFDDSFFCTAGRDGGLFVWRNTFESMEYSDLIDLRDNETVEDVTDATAYSLQEAKLKSEKDREIEEAEVKKQLTREYIQELRNEFLRLVAENEAEAAEKQISRDALRVDPYLRSDIDRETQEKIVHVRRELEWISEKESIVPNKLRRKFLSNLETERIEISSFKTNRAVATFRTTKLNQSLEMALQPLLASEKNPSRNALHVRALLSTKACRACRRESFTTFMLTNAPDDGRGDPKRRSAKPMDTRSKLEARKQLRAERSTMWKALMDQKPDDNYEDPRDASAYPEHRDIVTEQDIIQLQKEEAEAVAAAKSGGGDDPMGFGSGAPAGTATAAPAALQRPPSPTGGAGSRSRPATTGDSSHVHDAAAGSVNDAHAGHATDASGQGSETSQTRVDVQVEVSELEAREQDARRKLLLYRKDEILKTFDQLVKEFDVKVDQLEKERIVLEGDVKCADIKLLLLYREWVLLKEFEKYDNALMDKLTMKRNEKEEIDLKIKECQEKLNSKKTEIELVIKREKEIHDEFHSSLGENNKHEELLTKIFKRKIKRSKKKAKNDANARKGTNSAEASEDEEEEEEEDDDDMDEDSEGESMDSDSDADGGEECPGDCDAALFAKVLDLRERKLDQEDVLGEIQKAIEALRKENDSMIKKEKIIHMALKNTEAEIQDFQTQKQQKLNELDVVVPLRLHQIQYLERNALPSDLSLSLVFVNDGLAKLRNRIKQLQQEKADIRKQHKELRKMHVSLIKSKKEKQFKLLELEARAHDVQMLKFGQIIDLEKLERMGINKNADEMREKLQKEDIRRMRELQECEGKINIVKERLTEVTRENTDKLEKLVALTESKQRLEEALNSSQASVTAEYSGPQAKDVTDRDRLSDLVQQQAREIDGLKQEIESLIRKPMRTLPPV